VFPSARESVGYSIFHMSEPFLSFNSELLSSQLKTKNVQIKVRFEVFTVVKIWIVIPCIAAGDF
jgi:hypothetical protein